jgi:hypothetical protein
LPYEIGNVVTLLATTKVYASTGRYGGKPLSTQRVTGEERKCLDGLFVDAIFLVKSRLIFQVWPVNATLGRE